MDTYDYSPTYQTTADPVIGAGVGLAALAMVCIILLLVYVIHAFFLGLIFKKAGIESWKAWVPIYNTWVLLEMGGQAGWWSLLAFVPVVNIAATIFMYIAMYHIGLRLQKDGVFVLLAIFIPTAWIIWLAVDKSVWQGEKPSTVADTPEEV